jgi:hypothetical protein
MVIAASRVEQFLDQFFYRRRRHICCKRFRSIFLRHRGRRLSSEPSDCKLRHFDLSRRQGDEYKRHRFQNDRSRLLNRLQRGFVRSLAKRFVVGIRIVVAAVVHAYVDVSDFEPSSAGIKRVLNAAQNR